MNRQKTRKWANFKPQNYDGDEWGADYDEPEDEEEPPPPPPPKPMGPRHAATFSPTARQFQPAGSAPLRTQPQQHPAPVSARLGQHQAAADPSFVPGGTPRRATEPLGPSPHATQGYTPPHFSPNASRGSPAPQSAHPLPSQISPAQSRMSPDDVVNAVEALRRSGPSPRPGDSTSPRTEGSMASPTKPPPFVRPADLYRKVEEKRGTESQSQEIDKPRTEIRPGGPGGWETQPQGGAPTSHSLAPVAERKSEYGLEGFLDSYSTDPLDPEPTQEQAHAESVGVQAPVQPLSHAENLRRFSTSPQLPDFRVSGFGEDLFASSSFFPASGLRSLVSDNTEVPTSGRFPSGPGEPPATAAKVPVQSATGFTSPSVVPSAATNSDLDFSQKASQHVSNATLGASAVPSPPVESSQDHPAGPALHEGAAQPAPTVSEQQTPAVDAPREPTSRAGEPTAALATRPHLPGGWVSETPSTPAELAASPLAGTSRETPDTGKKAEPGNLSSIEAPRDVASLNLAPLRPLEPVEAVVSSKIDMAKDSGSVPPPPPSSHALPAHRTSSPALSSKSGKDTQHAPPEAPGIHASDSSSSVPESAAIEPSEILPTAPLKSRRGTPDGNSSTRPVLSSPTFGGQPTLEVSTSSPVNDSDMLSDEIIKALSPEPATGGFTDVVSGYGTAPRGGGAGLTRESSYLGDFYGDYWAATEDTTEPSAPTLRRPSEPAMLAQDPVPQPAELPEGSAKVLADSVDSTSVSDVPRAVPANVPDSQVGAAGLQKRFSWEVVQEGSAPATVSLPATEHLLEQKSLGSGAEKVALSASQLGASGAGISQAPLGLDGEKSAEDLRAESAPEFIPAGTLAPTPASGHPIPPPSPISTLEPTDRQGDASRFSLAEEKIAIQGPPHLVSPSPRLEQHPALVSPSPRLEQHPALVGAQPSRPAEVADAGSSQDMMGFRSIMEMPLPAERIKHYNEARWQFSAVNTGLVEWLETMTSKQPEHAKDVLPYPALGQPNAQGGAAQSAYGQGGWAPPHIHIPPQLQQGLSGLGHSGDRVGTKSKELFMAAGKAGKGLFSKGRNKLRGTN